jgi:hypothetical protein
MFSTYPIGFGLLADLYHVLVRNEGKSARRDRYNCTVVTILDKGFRRPENSLMTQEKHPMIKRIQTVLAQPWVFALALLGIAGLSYASHLTHLGFYWDDWQAVFLSRLAHPNQYVWAFFANDRPISAWTYAVLLPILGMKPAAWQICTLLARWAGTLCLYGTLVAVWPRYVWQARWMAALLIVFPGFTMQPISAAFNQHFITFLAFGFSFLTMVWAVRDSKRAWLWMTLSILSGVVHIFTMEYFAALEGLRPILLWVLLRKPEETTRQTAVRVLKYWAPLVVMLAIFAYWRFIYYPGTFSGDIRNGLGLLGTLRKSPLSAVRSLANAMIQDSAYLFVRAWTDQLGPTLLNLDASLRPWIAGIGVASGFGLLAGLAYRRVETPAPGERNFSLLIFGVAAFFLGGLPVWMTLRQVVVGKWSSRLALSPMIGVVIVLVFVIDRLLSRWAWKNVLLIGLLAMSIAGQFQNTTLYQADWTDQRNTYWQLSWRMPALQPGTAVLAAGVPANTLSDYSTAYAIVSLYAGKLSDPNPPYWFLTARSAGQNFAAFAPGLKIYYQVRDVTFNGSTSDAVAVSFTQGDCLRLLDPIYAEDPALSVLDRSMLAVSNLSRVQQKGTPPDADIFGSEPPHTWCYFFQKADLARQFKDWPQVIDLNAQAAAKQLTPQFGGELVPLIEAYAHSGIWPQALQTSLEAYKLTPEDAPMLCTLWTHYPQLPSAAGRVEAIQGAIRAFGCPAVAVQ